MLSSQWLNTNWGVTSIYYFVKSTCIKYSQFNIHALHLGDTNLPVTEFYKFSLGLYFLLSDTEVLG